MPTNRAGLTILRNSSSSGIRPGKVSWNGTGLSAAMSPNPDVTSIQLSYLTPTVDAPGQPVQGYRIYRNGVPVNPSAGTDTEPVLSGLTAGATYDWQVAAFNDQGEGPLSDVMTFTQKTLTQVAPNPPTAGSVVGTPTSDAGTVAWTASTTPDISGYNIYVNGALSPTYTTTDVTKQIDHLPSGRDNSVVVTAVKAGVESTGLAIVLTTAADTTTMILAKADDFLNTVVGQAKVTYGTGVHNYTNAANKQAVIDEYKAIGWRSYRQEVAQNTPQKAAQLDFMKAIYANQGGKFQANMGTVGWYGLFRINTYTEQETYAAAKEDVTNALSFLKSWLADTTLNITDLSQILHSIGGPNEVNDGGKTVNPNWARNARIYAETIWNLVRNGKLWNGVYTRAILTSSTGRKYYQYSVSTPGVFSTPTGASADFANYPTYFANVPIMGPSTKDAFSDAQIAELGGSILSSETGRLAGKSQLARFVEIGNPHQYQLGESPNRQRLSDAVDRWSTLIPNSGYTPSRPWEGTTQFTECGYNHMGFMPDGSSTTEGRGPGQTYNPTGNVKVPPWVAATYLPIMSALGFKMGWQMHTFELMDDDDTPSAGVRNYNIQAYYGHVWTPDNDPTTWSPLASFNCLRRFTNLLKDRTDPRVPPTFTPGRRPMTVIQRNGVEIVELTKQNGDTYYLVWRDGLSIFKDSIHQDNPRIAYTNSAGVEVLGLPPNVNVTMRLDHASGSGTRAVDIFRPNKARWINAGVATPTLTQAKDTRSVGHDDTSDWSGASPTPDTVVGDIASGASFTFAAPYDLVIVRVRG